MLAQRFTRAACSCLGYVALHLECIHLDYPSILRLVWMHLCQCAKRPSCKFSWWPIRLAVQPGLSLPKSLDSGYSSCELKHCVCCESLLIRQSSCCTYLFKQMLACPCFFLSDWFLTSFAVVLVQLIMACREKQRGI